MKRIILLLTLSLLAMLLPLTAGAEDAFAWDSASATYIDLDGQSGVITIDAAGTYVLSGTLADGQVLINATKDDDVRLVLNGASLSSSTSAPIYASQCDKLILILADGTENTVTDASTYVYEGDADEPDAAIFSKDDLRIGGSGTLTVTGNYRNGIGTKDDLIIAGGTITVTAVNDALRGRDSVTIQDGSITLNAGNDGIKANNDGDAEKGWITIEGGTLNITAAFDGIQAETALTVSGGTIDIVAGGGSANATPKQSESFGRGMFGGDTTTQTTETDSESLKGLKAGVSLTISGGTITVDAADDSLHSNGTLDISGGTMTLSTGDDGAHADTDLTVSGGTITVLTSYEGLEGTTVTISGGDIIAYASDDGLNAGGGSDESDAGTFFMGGGRSRGDDSVNRMDITGGNITIYAERGDGIDANGPLNISGGTITIYGPTGEPESAFDADGTITITGGIIMAGSAAGNGETPSASTSTQPTLIVYYNTPEAAGTVTLTDQSGQVLATYTTEKSFSSVWFSMPELAQGQTYVVTTSGGTVTETTLQSTVATVSQDGSATTPGRMGGMGGGGGRGNRPEGGGRNNTQQAPEGMPDTPNTEGEDLG